MAPKKKVNPKKKPGQSKKPKKNTKGKQTTLQALHDSQKRLSLALDSARMGIWEWDIKKNEIWWSEHVHNIFGTDEKTFAATYEAFLQFVAPDDKPAIESKIRETLNSGKKYFAQHRIIRTDGSIRWVESVGKTFVNRNGSPTKMMGSIQDITDLKTIDFQLKDWEERYKLIASSSGQVIYDYDLTTGRIAWSGTLLNVLGYADHEIRDNETWANLLHPEDKKYVIIQFERARQNSKSYDLKYRFKAKSKEYVHIHDKGFFHTNTSGKPYRMLGTMQDISDKIKIEADLLESNRFNQSMENAMPGMLYVYDLVKEVNVYINHNIPSLLGYDWEEIEQMGNNVLHQLMHPDDVVGLPQWSNEPTRTVKDSEYRMRTKSGEWRWFHSRDTVFQRDKKGNVVQIIGIAQDITDRKKIEKELRESEQRFRILQEASFGGIGLHDKGIIIDCNQGLSDITGYSREELIGNDGLKLVAAEYRELVMQNILSNYEKPYDVEGIHKDGTRYSLEVQGKNIPYKGRTIRVTEFRNITARKLTEQKIIEQNASLRAITSDLKRKNDQLEEFTQIVSHNLRSPMGNILTLLTFMENSDSDEDKAQFMKYLKESSHNALTTLEELNEVLKLKQNKNIEKQHLEFAKVLDQVRAMVSAKIAERSAEIYCDFSQAPTLFYPHIYLESIFLNLLTNALKYSKPDEKAVIEIRTYCDKNDTILEVKDNGLGINLQRYGHQIFRLQKTFHKHPESRGIGLFMIKNQIEVMGGEISVQSQENVGTTFIINFNKHHSNEDITSGNRLG